MSHEQLTELAESEPAGCCGLTFLPYLVGERTPNWPQATGSLLGLRPGAAGCMMRQRAVHVRAWCN
jgi:xylulokinase